eukprot:4102883-Prymnesium_polylepis.1
MWPTSQVQILPEGLRTHGLPERYADKGDRREASWLGQGDEHGLEQLAGQCQEQAGLVPVELHECSVCETAQPAVLSEGALRVLVKKGGPGRCRPGRAAWLPSDLR